MSTEGVQGNLQHYTPTGYQGDVQVCFTWWMLLGSAIFLVLTGGCSLHVQRNESVQQAARPWARLHGAERQVVYLNNCLLCF